MCSKCPVGWGPGRSVAAGPCRFRAPPDPRRRLPAPPLGRQRAWRHARGSSRPSPAPLDVHSGGHALDYTMCQTSSDTNASRSRRRRILVPATIHSPRAGLSVHHVCVVIAAPPSAAARAAALDELTAAAEFGQIPSSEARWQHERSLVLLEAGARLRTLVDTQRVSSDFACGVPVFALLPTESSD